MSIGHNRVLRRLGRLLDLQLDPERFEVSENAARAHRPDGFYYIPDLMVIPTALIQASGEPLDALEVYTVPLPLVVEVWSPSTGDYDIDAKVPVYQERGDLEIWRIHPFERTLTAWRRQPGGGYVATTYTRGTIQPVALPDVTIQVEALFDF